MRKKLRSKAENRYMLPCQQGTSPGRSQVILEETRPKMMSVKAKAKFKQTTKWKENQEMEQCQRGLVSPVSLGLETVLKMEQG